MISQSVMKLRESVDTTDLKARSLSPLNHVFFYLSFFDASDQPVCDEAARISLSRLNYVFFYLSFFDASDQPVCDEAARIC